MTFPTLFLLFAPSGQTGSRGLIVFMLQMVAFIGIIYFLMIRPKVQQEKRHKERLAKVKRGDQVVTAGGVMGEVVHVKEEKVTIKSGDTRLVIHRDRLSDISSPGEKEPT